MWNWKKFICRFITQKYDYNIIELALDDDRHKDYITNKIKPLLKTKKTINGKKIY